MHIEYFSEWFAVQVKYHAERAVTCSLESKGFEAFLPVYSSTRAARSPHLPGPRVSPLFPGYVFLRFKEARPGSIITTPGVIRILGTASGPSKIEESEINALKRFVDLTMNPEPVPYLEVGQRVLLKEGPLAGLSGLIVKRRNSYRLVVSVSLLQRSVGVDVESTWLRHQEEGTTVKQLESGVR